MFLIKRFVPKNEINFGLEMKCAKILLTQYPDQVFWQGFWTKYGNMRTLLDLRSAYWQDKLASFQKECIIAASLDKLDLDKQHPKNPEIQENYLGWVGIHEESKPKTLKEFLK